MSETAEETRRYRLTGPRWWTDTSRVIYCTPTDLTREVFRYVRLDAPGHAFYAVSGDLAALVEEVTVYDTQADRIIFLPE